MSTFEARPFGVYGIMADGGSGAPTGDVFLPSDSDRPTDEAILTQQNALRDDEAKNRPLVGDKEPLSALAAEYESGSATFQEKIEHLSSDYSAIRRSRGDGNCFFRCFLFALLEHLLHHGTPTAFSHFRQRIAASEQALRDLGYSEFTWEDFSGTFKELVDAAESKQTEAFLLQQCQEEGGSNYAVMFLRFATSAEIQRRSEFFHPFLPDPFAGLGSASEGSVQFSRACVEPMGEESDHVQIVALTDALETPIRIVHLDRSAGQTNFHDLLPDSSSEASLGTSASGLETPAAKSSASRPPIVMLYRPGHYDILYAKE